MTAINVTTLIHLIIPIFWIPLFVCNYFVIAGLLFTKKDHQQKRYHFVWLIEFFYMLLLPLETHIALTPFRNIWNGKTLAASCLFPLLVVFCLQLIRYFVVPKTSCPDCSVITLSEIIIGLISLCFSIQLCLSFGYVLSSLFILASVLIIVVRNLYSSHFNKKTTLDIKGGVIHDD